MSDFDLIVRGKLVLPNRIFEDGYVAVIDGRIARIGFGEPPAAKELHDCRGAWVVPGAVDGQTHTGSANHEWLGQASRAAAAGGVTTLVDMPYDEPEPAWSAEVFLAKAAKANADCHIDVGLYATIRPRDGLDAIPGLIEAGACAFKFSTFEANAQRFPRIDDAMLYQAMLRIAPSGLACGVHNQHQEMTLANIARLRAAGDTGWDAFGRAHPPLVENLATANIYEIGAATGARAHAVHISLSRGFQLCNQYRAAGVQASAETCVQYLMLNEEEHMRRLGAKTKHYPPIRPKAEVDKLWTHIANGDCDFVSSDHVAWGLDRKGDPDIFNNAAGGPGLETLVPALWTGCLEHGISPAMAVRLLSEGPAKFFLMHDKGSLEPGKDADIVVLEPGRFVHDPANSLAAVNWSAFEGRTFDVRVAATFLRGKLAWDGRKIVNAAGAGRLQKPLRRGA
ncbi:dihydroorotase [Stutzerimonas kirkiae]|uniref:Allantoinase n=1 Tax=Stutzerimonas kirkiae TaxID=2211392 RepID=A0A4Q9QYP7_9GAMM|nr:amidohydrolase family protein [Stutzerimonas kirkiae]TBU90332.1 allantoinase [Stutzerimonas kirkiae]TBU98003.1 allantoinase [Stutzerimonas kirkiae]TBV12310.1 allantoinase [Stutzerimonas kirkiae]TBV13186.1 allantoinase [Stutzerimonas kirkiae]